MDETLLNFDMLGNKATGFKRVKTVHIKHTEYEKMWFRVILFCLADSEKLKPIFIFKRKSKRQIDIPPAFLFRGQTKQA